MTLLNIITVTKDDFEGFSKTIQSTRELRKNFDVLQIIIDSSTSNVKQKIDEAISLEEKIIYKWQQPSGISNAFNLGLEISCGEWIWFLNGGDILIEELDIALFLNILSRSDADAIIFQTEYMQASKKLKNPPLWALWPPVLSWIPHPSTIVKREIYKKFNGFDKNLKLAMDYEFWIKCFSNNVIVDLISIPIVKFDQLGASMEQNRKTRAEVRNVIRRYFWIILKRLFWQVRIILKSFVISSRFYENKKQI
ncbi:MAG: glycosyltransferase [Candidatus Humimicrobiaceae bacterium]